MEFLIYKAGNPPPHSAENAFLSLPYRFAHGRKISDEPTKFAYFVNLELATELSDVADKLTVDFKHKVPWSTNEIPAIVICDESR